MAEIVLNNGMIALVDDEDYERVSKYKWHATHSNHRLGREDQYIPYARTSMKLEDGRTRMVRLHRFVMNAPDGRIVDHKFGNPLDCRKASLRLATHSQNSANRAKVKALHQLKGVQKVRNRFRASITVEGKYHHLGYFDTEFEAHQAYMQAAQQHFGEFARAA